jgi:hypothetical protein
MFLKLRSKVYTWLYDAHMDEVNEYAITGSEPMKSSGANRKSGNRGVGFTNQVKRDSGDTLASNGITFKVIPGTGGVAIETSQYDTFNDRYINNLHIVSDDTELSAALAQIITMESLRR